MNPRGSKENAVVQKAGYFAVKFLIFLASYLIRVGEETTRTKDRLNSVPYRKFEVDPRPLVGLVLSPYVGMSLSSKESSFFLRTFSENRAIPSDNSRLDHLFLFPPLSPLG